MITVITHANPDTDALMSAAAVVYLAAGSDDAAWARCRVIFDSHPDRARHDGRSTFIVDVARTPLDHHQLPDPRSTCAFSLVCEHFIACGDASQVLRARALLARVAPAVLRQDSTGSLDPEREATVIVLGLPHLINALVWQAQDDAAVGRHLWPMIRRIFDEQVAVHTAEQHPADVLAQATVTPSASGRVVGVETTLTIGAVSPRQHLRAAVEQVYPDCVLQIFVTHWLRRDGSVATISRGVARRAGETVSVRDLLAQVRTQLPPAVQQEIASWYQEAFFCGAGTVKFPRQDAPPAGLSAALVRALEGIADHAPPGTCTRRAGGGRPDREV